MFKKIFIGMAAGASIFTLGYIGLIAYATHEITKELNGLLDEEEV